VALNLRLRTLVNPSAGSRFLLRRFSVVGLVAFALVGLGVSQLLANQIRSGGLGTAEFHAQFVQETIVDQELQSGNFGVPMSGSALESFDRVVQDQVLRSGVVHFGIWNRNGELVYSSDRDAAPGFPAGPASLQRTLAGEIQSGFAELSLASHEEDVYSDLFRSLVPVTPTGARRPEGVAVFYQLSEPIIDQIRRAQIVVLGVVFTGLGLLFLGLYPLLRRHAGILLRQNEELAHRTEQLERGSIQTIQMLNRLANAKDPYTGGHIGRVADLAQAVGRRMALGDREMRALALAAEFHDIGKVAIPDAILNKPGRLTPEERAEIEKHPALGVGILEGSELFREAIPGILHHHERFDGSGYPARLAGRGIPLIARIITAIDAYDAMTSDRPYRRALSDQVAWGELLDGVGTQFCPDTVAALADVTGTRVQVPQGMSADVSGETVS
jgi:HD domain